jgi:hypothetical protein
VIIAGTRTRAMVIGIAAAVRRTVAATPTASTANRRSVGLNDDHPQDLGARQIGVVAVVSEDACHLVGVDAVGRAGFEPT